MKNEVSFNLDFLEHLVDQLDNGAYVKVGILGDDAERSDADDGGNLTNAEIGFIQMKGSFTHNIPPRDWLLMPLVMHSKQILSFVRSKKVKDAILAGKPQRALGFIGAYCEAWIQSAFASRGFGQWAPNAPITIQGGWMTNKKSGKPFYVEGKKSSAPLINSGELRKSVSSEVVIP